MGVPVGHVPPQSTSSRQAEMPPQADMHGLHRQVTSLKLPPPVRQGQLSIFSHGDDHWRRLGSSLGPEDVMTHTQPLLNPPSQASVTAHQARLYHTRQCL